MLYYITESPPKVDLVLLAFSQWLKGKTPKTVNIYIKIIAGKGFFSSLFATVCASIDINVKAYSYVCKQPCLTCCHLQKSAPYLAECVIAEEVNYTASHMHVCIGALGAMHG